MVWLHLAQLLAGSAFRRNPQFRVALHAPQCFRSTRQAAGNEAVAAPRNPVHLTKTLEFLSQGLMVQQLNSAIKPTVLAAIGNTPLIRLRGASDETGCEILGKAEFLNPGQSVKDRAALFIIQRCDERGRCGPAARLSKARQATPASGWRWSPMRWVSRP